MRLLVSTLVLALCHSVPTFNHNNIDTQFRPQTEGQFRKREHQLKAKLKQQSTPAFEDFSIKPLFDAAPDTDSTPDAEMRFQSARVETETETETETDAEMNARIEAEVLAMSGAELDAYMYGGHNRTFVPHPGHDLHFDFKSFAEMASEQEKHFMAGTDEMSIVESTGTYTTTNFIQACLEINVCQIMPDVGPNICGMFGIDGAVEYEKESAAKANLHFKLAVNIGVSFGAKGLFAISFYITGSIDVTVEIANPTYGSVYGALFAWCKDMLSRWVSGRTQSKKFLARAEETRLTMIADLKKLKPPLSISEQAAQSDELSGFTKIHRKILFDFVKKLKPAMTPAQANTALAECVYDNIWENLVAPKKRVANAVSLDKMMSAADLKCSNLKTAFPADGLYRMFFCSLMKYGAMLKDPQRGGFWTEGSVANCGRSVAALYPELTASDTIKVADIIALVADWNEYATKVPGDKWDEVTSVTYQASQPTSGAPPSGTGKAQKETKVLEKSKAVQISNMHDPCATLRGIASALATPAAELKKFLDKTWPNDKKFTMTSVTLEGTVGATLGSSRVGYCTADSNVFQAQLVYSREWNKDDGWKKSATGSNLKLWLRFNIGSFFGIEVELNFQEDSIKIGLQASLPSGDGSPGAADDNLVAKSTQTPLSGITADNLMAVGQTAVKLLKRLKAAIKGKTKKGPALDAFKTGTKTAVDAAGMDGLVAKIPDPMGASVKAKLGAGTKTLLKNLLGTAVQAGVAYAMSLSPLSQSTMMTIDAAWTGLPAGKEKVESTLAMTSIFKLGGGAVDVAAFYVIWGTSISAEKIYKTSEM